MIFIKEFLPNPVGSDKEGEYIKFFNDGDAVILLNGWSVKDAAGKTFNLTGSLPAGQELVLPHSQTKIFLNNNGEEVLLYSPAGELIDQLNYSGQAEEGQVIVRNQRLEISELKNEQSNFNLPITNSPISGNIIFLGFLIVAILAALGLYIILQLEKKFNEKIF